MSFSVEAARIMTDLGEKYHKKLQLQRLGIIRRFCVRRQTSKIRHHSRPIRRELDSVEPKTKRLAPTLDFAAFRGPFPLIR